MNIPDKKGLIIFQKMLPSNYSMQQGSRCTFIETARLKNQGLTKETKSFWGINNEIPKQTQKVHFVVCNGL